MKHNQQIQNQHFRKDWAKYIKTWFNQPARKVRRRQSRAEKAKKLLPRPLHRLRPVVQCNTVKYNMKARAGKGFSLEELKAAKVRRQEAKGLGISVDHRRRNKSEEGFARNVQRLTAYKGKLVLFPRHPNSQRVKKSNAKEGQIPVASRAEMKATFSQNTDKNVFAISNKKKADKPRKATDAEKAFKANFTVRQALIKNKFAGQWAKKAADKKAKAAAPKAEAAE